MSNSDNKTTESVQAPKAESMYDTRHNNEVVALVRVPVNTIGQMFWDNVPIPMFVTCVVMVIVMLLSRVAYTEETADIVASIMGLSAVAVLVVFLVMATFVSFIMYYNDRYNAQSVHIKQQ